MLIASSADPREEARTGLSSSGARVAVLTRGLQGGGVQAMMMNTARELVARGFAVDLLPAAHYKPAASLPAGINVERLAGAPRVIGRIMAWRADPAALPVLARPVLLSLVAPEPLRLLPALVRYLRTRRPAALISATTYTNLVAIWARALSGVPTRILISERDHLSQNIRAGRSGRAWRWRYSPALLARVYPMADAIVAVSDGVAADLAELTGIDRTRIHTVYNPVVTPELYDRAAITPDEPWFSPGEPPVIISAGRLVQKKDFATLLEAFARVRQARNARLIILGSGRERHALEALRHRLCIAADAKLIGWVDNPYAYMARAAVFAFSSVREGFGNVLVEALACGCPVVATDCPSGPAEILDNGRYGRLVRPGDVEGLAAALLETLVVRPDPEPLRRRAQIFAAQHATDRYLELLGLR